MKVTKDIMVILGLVHAAGFAGDEDNNTELIEYLAEGGEDTTIKELEAKLAGEKDFSRLLKHKLTDRSTLSVKEVAEMSEKLKVAVEALEKVAVLSQGGIFYDLSDEALEKIKGQG